MVGEGQFGEVFKGQLVNYDGYLHHPSKNASQQVAIKQLKCSHEFYVKDLYDEAQRMLILKHPYIVTIYGLCKHESGVSLILELCPYGAMNRWLKQNR